MSAALLIALLLPAYGEPVEGVPNQHERLLHVLTNQVRQDPHGLAGLEHAAGDAGAPLRGRA